MQKRPPIVPNYEGYRLPDFVEYTRVNDYSYIFRAKNSEFVQVKITSVCESQCCKKYKSKKTYNINKYYFELAGHLVNFTCLCINDKYYICDVWLTHQHIEA